MASYNKVIILGNATRDPELRHLPNGTAVTELGLAVSRQWFDKHSNQRKEETTFVDVTLWGRTAEVAAEYVQKGKPVLIEGRLHLDQWEDKQSGQKRQKLKVVGEHLTLMGGGKKSDDQTRGQSTAGEEPQFAPQEPVVDIGDVPF